jgi:GNAT superfamily N-acetyltransferase
MPLIKSGSELDGSETLTQRPANAADWELLYEIMRQSLGPYIEQAWGIWDEVAQRKRFGEVTRIEHHSILELDGKPIGCVCVKPSDVEIRLVRLFIVPPFQNRGYGTRILIGILASADRNGLPVRLRVLRVNPARRLYERHGFVVAGETETHYTMVRSPITCPIPV